MALAGCSEIVVTDSRVEQRLPSLASSLVIGETTHAGVRSILGTPLLASDYWRFELFGISGRNAVKVGGTPDWLGQYQDVQGYMLVAYDPAGRVSGFDHGVAAESSIWTGPSYPSKEALLAADGLVLVALKDQLFLAASGDRSDDYLSREVPGDRCRFVLGCKSRACRAVMDAGKDLRFEMPGAPRLVRPVAVIELARGIHRITARPASPVHDGSFRGEASVECLGGETAYVALEIRPELPEPVLWPTTYADLIVLSEMPYDFGTPSLLIWGQGQWMVPAEPGP